MYFYDKNVVDYSKTIVPSKRNELEITDLNRIYLKKKSLKVNLLDKSFKWWDTGTFDSLIEASDYVHDHYVRTGYTINSPEQVAFNQDWISKEKMLALSVRYGNSPYGAYLKKIAEGKSNEKNNDN